MKTNTKPTPPTKQIDPNLSLTNPKPTSLVVSELSSLTNTGFWKNVSETLVVSSVCSKKVSFGGENQKRIR